MKKQPQPGVFLERSSYRQRRLRDAGLLVPVLGIILWLVPLLWDKGDPQNGKSMAMLYIFGVWVLLILLTALIARLIRPSDDKPSKDEPA
ncbi:hypothetical protein [Yoonia sp. 2307UL14-13]|uniref:hypothetical protein n=1 Tax=Yoonia sp. 2307UL14-13 TaxID=3126506 RepID=UPI0030A49A38